jgi:hypothetical protein
LVLTNNTCEDEMYVYVSAFAAGSTDTKETCGY